MGQSLCGDSRPRLSRSQPGVVAIESPRYRRKLTEVMIFSPHDCSSTVEAWSDSQLTGTIFPHGVSINPGFAAGSYENGSDGNHSCHKQRLPISWPTPNAEHPNRLKLFWCSECPRLAQIGRWLTI